MASRLTNDEAERGVMAAPPPTTSGATSINTGLNLDGALPASLEVEAVIDGETHSWTLKDDISSAVLMRGIELDRLQTLITTCLDEGDTEGALDAQRRYDSLTDFVFLAIFKASYPTVDVELLRRGFDRLDRVRLAMRFFDLRMRRPSAVSIAGETSPATPRERAETAEASGQSKVKKLKKALEG